MQTTINVIAGCFALSAFAVALLTGLAVGNSADLVLLRAVIVVLVCYPVGWAAGGACVHVIRARLKAHQSAHPLPKPRESEASRSQHDEEPIVI